MVKACLFFFLLILNTLGFSQALEPNDNDTTSHKSEILSTYISEKLYDISLEDALYTLHKNYSVNFSYVNDFIPLKTKVSVIAEREPLADVLNRIFRGLPVTYLTVGNQIVLVKKEEFLVAKNGERKAHDSVSVSTLKFNNKLKRFIVSQKVSIVDFLNGNVFFNTPESEISRSILLIDSTQVLNDSLLARERRLRRERIRLIKGKNWGKTALFFLLQPELTGWKIKGTTNQSIDYERYNDYKNPDVSVSLLIGTSYRFYRGLFFRPSVILSVFSRNGIHTNHLVSVFNPTITQPVNSEFTSRYGYVSLSGQLGYENKFKNGKFVVGIGYFYGLMVAKAAPDYFPYYEPKYYSSGSEFYNRKLEKLKPEKIPYRQFLPGIVADILICRNMGKNFEFVGGISSKVMLKSIYLKTAPIGERAFSLGVSLGVRYNIKS